MPKVEIEIFRTVEITREESAVVELDVPKRVLDKDEVLSWVSEIMDKDDDGSMTTKEKAVHAVMTGADWDPSDEDETVQYNEAYVVD